MTLLSKLLPTGRNRVIDLVQAAGINIGPWSQFKGGPAKAATNPRFCYEWAFIEPGKVVVLNLWHAHLKEQKGNLWIKHNMRADAEALAKRGAKTVWIGRARRFDAILRTAFERSLRLRVILNEGTMRTSMDPDSNASKVRFRRLDPIPWTIDSYDLSSGAYVLTRGGTAVPLVDQFDIPALDTGVTEKVTSTSTAFVRSPIVRRHVLNRANGDCEYCGMAGFELAEGGLFLETHHILPLSEGGPDTTVNVAAVCPNHHREAHLGTMAPHIRDVLLKKASA